MILVTAYPLGYAIVLSTYSYRLTDPEGREFVGLKNYVTVLTDPVWWGSVSTTAIITVASVLIELVLGVTGSQAGVAHFAHLGGMVAGFALIQYWRHNRRRW